MQVVISDPKTGKAYKLEGKDTEVSALFVGKRIGDLVDGDILGLSGYMLEVRGGSDRDGVPMRADVPGAGRRRILIASPPGYRPREKGKRRRKYVRGNEISTDISQINVKIRMYGHQPIEKIFGEVKEGGEA
ncbi:MAG: 30S ribosomal protein S6e [Candidatus Methanophagaceae archaeon]|nr:MAG: 30S ribosomal protein S6e [Methanophagales archaeon]